MRLLYDVRASRRQGVEAITRRQQARLAHLVNLARTRSVYFGEIYHGLPDRVTDPTLLPVTDKAALMERFDEWVTDRAVTLDDVERFAADTRRVGHKFLDRYQVATTSGTSGTRGIFVLDQRSLTVATALSGRMLGAWLSIGDAIRIGARGGRIAMVIATGGHFASAVAAASLRSNRLRRAMIRVFPVDRPMPELTAELNAFRPAILAPYASTGAQLASEQQAGRLQINPVLVALSAEGLPAKQYGRIADTFDAKVRHSWAATECPFLSYSCQHGWLHVNSDWVIVEPVDADHRPVPPGQPSHTTLVTNLANKVQPVVRYDLGDTVTMRPDPCPCGDPLPALQVHGRTGELLTFPTHDGNQVTIAPLSLSALLDATSGVDRFQIVQAAPERLNVRLRTADDADPEHVWQAAHAAISRVLADHNVAHVTVERDPQPPQQTSGGKVPTVVPLPPGSQQPDG